MEVEDGRCCGGREGPLSWKSRMVGVAVVEEGRRCGVWRSLLVFAAPGSPRLLKVLSSRCEVPLFFFFHSPRCPLPSSRGLAPLCPWIPCA